LLSAIVRLWWRTLRIRVDAGLARFLESSRPLIITLWHRDLFSIGELQRRFPRKRPLVAMVSASRDGEWLASLLGSIGIGSIRGSSGHGALGVYGAAREKLRSGCDVAITPDGPRGPKFQCKGGAIRLALETGATILAFHFSYGRAGTLKSWDEFRIPLPFSTVSIGISYLEPQEFLALGGPGPRSKLLGARLSGVAHPAIQINPDL
jgi:lysophospholipid acyltransferase (LPLAT)-like uncharacterized protein